MGRYSDAEYLDLADSFDQYKRSKEASYQACQREVNRLTTENRKLRNIVSKQDGLYEELFEAIAPYIGDFTGYDEENQCFNIILAVKELIER